MRYDDTGIELQAQVAQRAGVAAKMTWPEACKQAFAINERIRELDEQITAFRCGLEDSLDASRNERQAQLDRLVLRSIINAIYDGCEGRVADILEEQCYTYLYGDSNSSHTTNT